MAAASSSHKIRFTMIASLIYPSGGFFKYQN
jgi:hypothetical protein